MASKRWCFTLWSDSKFKKFELCDFMIFQTEKCPKTQRIHYQGYIEFKKEYKLSQVKSLFKEKGMYVDKAFKSREENILYCSKSNTFDGRRVTYIDNILSDTKTEEISDWDDFNEIFGLDK